jgi:Transposase, Mutator family
VPGSPALCAELAPLQAARAQQRYSEQRGGRARRAAGRPRGKPLFDDPARVLLTLVYQRQACSMNVLADLLEVTNVCIGDLVRETREILEDHGHATGTAAVRFPTAQALRAFLHSDVHPERAQVIEQLSSPALTAMSRASLHKLTGNSHRCKPRAPSALATSGVAVPASPLPAVASSIKRSAMPSGSCWPSSTSDSCAPWTCSPASWASAALPSATPSARPSPSWTRPGTSSPRRRGATAPAPTCSPPQPRQSPRTLTRRQVDSLRVHYHRNLLTRVPKSAQPWVSTLVRTIFEQPDAASVRAQHAQVLRALEAKLPQASAHLDDARDDILAFAAFPREVWRQVWSNSPQERLDKEVRRRTDVVGIFPNRGSIIRLVGAVLAEQDDE